MKRNKAKKVLEEVKATYNRIADEFSESRQNPVREFVHFQQYLKNNAHIIDLGCGNGRLLISLEEYKKIHPEFTCDFLGVDNSPKLLESAQKLHPNAKFILGDQLAIHVENNSADIIFNIRAFHHIPSKKFRLKALNEMRRILKSDGILILTVWNLWQKTYRKYIALALLRFLYSFGAYAPNDTFIPWNNRAKRYYHAFTPGELSKIVNQTGFEIMEMYYIRNDGNKISFKNCHDIVIIAKKNEL